MKAVSILIFLLLSSSSFSQESANYRVLPGKLHQKGKVVISTLPDSEIFKVQMDYKLVKKNYVPVPSKFLKGRTVMEFPEEFRTSAGYKELQKKKTMSIPKATLIFIKRADIQNLKKAFFIQVLPNNKKSKIDIVYHPGIPSVGWANIKITFISKIPLLDGYELKAEVKQ